MTQKFKLLIGLEEFIKTTNDGQFTIRVTRYVDGRILISLNLKGSVRSKFFNPTPKKTIDDYVKYTETTIQDCNNLGDIFTTIVGTYDDHNSFIFLNNMMDRFNV
jgi:hypothetical protein